MKQIVLSQSGSSTEPPARPTSAHTLSIWAHHAFRNGLSPNAAVKTILDRIKGGSVRPDVTLYNTALHICGQGGLFAESARILYEMFIRNITPTHHTICSILNAIAENAVNLPQNPIEILESADLVMAKEDSNWLQAKTRHEAAIMAIILYSMWIEHNKVARNHAFSCLLKVLSRTGRKDLLELIFPLKKESPLVPANINVVAYTSAIHICGRDFKLAKKYWDAALANPEIRTCSYLIAAICSVLRDNLAIEIQYMGTTDLKAQREFFQKLFDSFDRVEFDFRCTNLILELSLRLGAYDYGVKFWQDHVLPSLIQKETYKDQSVIDHISVTMMMRLLMRLENPRGAIQLLELLISRFGLAMQMSFLVIALEACRVMGDFDLFEEYVEHHLREKKLEVLNSGILEELLVAIDDNPNLSILDKQRRILDTISWFKSIAPELQFQSSTVSLITALLYRNLMLDFEIF